MRIDDSNLTGTQAYRTQATQAPDFSAAEAAGRTASGDRAEISGLAGTLGRILAQHSGERAERVRALAQHVQSGRYNPDPKAVSRSLANEMLSSAAGAQV